MRALKFVERIQEPEIAEGLSWNGRLQMASLAPNGIKKLRDLILELAVRGKLVPQNPKDEPASDLLRRVKAEREKLARAGKGKNKITSEILDTEKPFHLPENWQWARLCSLGETQTGTTPSKSQPHLFGRDYPFIKPGDIYPNYVDYNNEGLSRQGAEEYGRVAASGSLLMVCIGTIGKCNLIERHCSFNQQINSVTPILIDSKYLLIAVRANNFQRKAWGQSSSTTIAILNKGKWEEMILPIPPLAEQQRIVAKVDELMALCDRLEAQKEDAAAAHETLVKALLGTLTHSQAVAEFQENWQRIAKNFNILFTTESSIDTLKQTLLQLAVMGKLVPQDPNDEPAAELLKRIKAEKEKMVKAGKIKKDRSLPEITNADKPFELPQGWVWTRLGHLSELVTSGSRDWAKFYSEDGAIFVRMGNLSRGSYQLRLNSIQHVRPPKDGEGNRTKLNQGDILISITGEVGLLGLIPENFGEAYINQHTCMVRPVSLMKSRFIPELLKSPMAIAQFNEPQRGIKNSFRLTDVTEMLVPLPPLSEQRRIVAKVDELMALCDSLKERLTKHNALHEHLATALVERAVAGN